ncbi:hypothetical protein BJ912DRAFT_928276 [Pholiota molesta]|nr:hypothetical protein BJ912DRAFT_928276 [Pholiota molesta]
MCPKDPKKTFCVHIYTKDGSAPYSLPYDGDEDGIISLHDRFCACYFFEEILAKCPNDLELAVFLRDRVLQLPEHGWSLGRANIGKYSLRYIKDCGLSYTDHTHISDLSRCLICEEKEKKAPKPDDEDAWDAWDLESR